MATKLFSFLGTGEYISCNYYLEINGEKYEDKDRSYVQEALFNILFSAGENIDEVVIFLTEAAKKNNWEKNKKYSDKPGLEKSLAKYNNLVKISSVDIPVGMSEEELWEIFAKVIENIQNEDTIFFDITHSFRSLPLLAIIILNYAKFVKKCKLKGVYYGAVEKLDRLSNLDNANIKEINAPIFDLTPFVDLLDWTTGIDRFINTGDANPIVELTKKDARKMWIKGEKENKKNFEELAYELENFSQVISTCRGQKISASVQNLKSKVKGVLDKKGENYIKPIGPLLEMLDKRFSTFNNNDYNNMLESARWCYEHNLIQQGLTILQESIISFICEKYNLELINENKRELVNQVVYIKLKDLPYDKWKKEAQDNRDVVEKMLFSEIFNENFCNLMRNISNLRNDINHAGWRENPSNPNKFKQNLEKLISEAENILASNS